METSTSSPVIIRFGPYEMNPCTSEIRNRGIRVRLQEQPFQVLAALVGQPGQLVTREELRRRVWPQDTFVDFDHALNTAVKKIRAALNDDADAPRFVETVPRRGYRFIAPVSQDGVDTDQQSSNTLPKSARALWASLLRPRIAFAVFFSVALVVGLVVYLEGRHEKTRAARLPERVMVAVLPFQNMSSDPSQDYFSDGMTEETITQLGRLNPERIGVIARTSAMKYKHAAMSIGDIGKELNAEYVLEGSVRREGTRVRIDAKLIRANDQSPRWTKDFDSNLGDAISMETDVARAIAAEIESALGEPSHWKDVSSQPVQPEAYDAYLHGRFESSMMTEEGLKHSISAFQNALALDPNCAPTWAGLATAYDNSANFGFLAPRDAFAKAKNAALRAIQIDPTYPGAHVYLADTVLSLDFNWTEAQEEIKRALALNPNDPFAHEWYGLYFALSGRSEDAARELARASELDPLATERMVTTGAITSYVGRLDDAEISLNQALTINPYLVHAHDLLAEVYERQGKKARAVEQFSIAYRLRGETAAEMALTQTYVTSGYSAAKNAALREDLVFWKSVAKKRYVAPYWIARDYSQLGDREQAFEWLQRAYDERDSKILCLRMEKNTDFAAIGGDPRYQALLDKLNYPK
jgi:TolB-like protein/DNA-binding winged helix-turn-helix (wHTH) protein/Flp pilus assembly protein TadD